MSIEIVLSVVVAVVLVICIAILARQSGLLVKNLRRWEQRFGELNEGLEKWHRQAEQSRERLLNLQDDIKYLRSRVDH